MKRKLICGILSFCVAFCCTGVILNAEPQFVCGGFGALSGITLDKDGYIVVTDVFENVVRKIKNGEDTIIAGRITSKGEDGIPVGGYKDDTSLKALFSSPWGIIPFSDGWVVSDSDNHVIRYISNGKVYSSENEFETPTGLAVDDKGNIYVSDTGKNVIYCLDKDDNISVWAEGFNEPTGLFFKDGIMYVADSGNHRICMIKNGEMLVVSGGKEGFSNGKAENAEFSSPQGIAVDDNNVIYVADTGNGAIRKISEGIVTTLVESSDSKTWPVSPRGIAIDKNKVFVSDVFAGIIFSLDTKTKVFSDVPESNVYFEAIKNMCGFNVMEGYDDGKFHPDDKITREMMAVSMCNMKKMYDCSLIISGSHDFKDIDKDSPYFSHIGEAFEDGWIKGTGDGNFLPDDNITRQEAITMIYRFINEKTTDYNNYAVYKDKGDVADWAADAIDWAVAKKIMSFDENGCINPKEEITRGQAADMLYKIFLYI